MLIIVSILIAVATVVVLLTNLEVHRRLHPDSPPITSLPPGSPFSRADFKSEDGLNIVAWYAPPPGDSGDAVLLLHGHSGNRDQLLVHADYLLEAGYGLLSIDFRHHGESDGTFTSMGYYEIKDARAAYRYLAQKPGVERIVIWGHSMGGAVAAQLMSEVAAAGLVIDATFADFAALVRDRVSAMGFPAFPIAELYVWLFGVLSRSDLSTYRPIDDLARVDLPTLLFHGSDDAAIPLSHAEGLAAANPKVRLSIFDGGAHSDLYELDPERYQGEVLTYLASAFATARGA